MRRKLPGLFAIAFLILTSQSAAAQRGAGPPAMPRGGGHTLYGDFKIEDGNPTTPKPQSFQLVLYNANMHQIGREPVANNGRFRFSNLANGEYYIGVELEAQEVTRILVRLAEDEKTEIRKDITLEWKADTSNKGVGRSEAVSAVNLYNRPPANRALLERAQGYIRNKEFKEAVPLLGQIVAADPKDFVVWTELGTVHFRQENLGEAEKAYEKAIQQQPTFVLALLNLGKVRIARKNFEGAIEVLTRAVQAQPPSAEANYYLGESYLQVKKGSKAVGYLNEAIRLDSKGMAEAHLRLAALYNGAGLKDRAANEYEQFLSKRPDYPDKEKMLQYIKENKKQ